MQFKGRTFDALPDPADFRDRLFEPTLVEVPTHTDLRAPGGYFSNQPPVLNQGKEGACTGFALGTVANYLLRRRKVVPDPTPVSVRMLYEMARRHDEWAGEDYEGSSARGAVKGWHKYGVCSNQLAPYKAGQERWELTNNRLEDAITRPLGAYYRVNHKDLVAMHAAITEVGILFATSVIHPGWLTPDANGQIQQQAAIAAAHAFALVGYDADGFWLQNSWGSDWGAGGLGKLSYDDWLNNGSDVWVLRLGVPVVLRSARADAQALASAAEQSATYAQGDVRPHIVSVGNDGRLRETGTYGTSKADVARLFRHDLPTTTATWTTPRLLLYAHGGLVSENSAVQRVADYRSTLLENEIYPIAFIWKTDFWTTLRNVLEDALRKRRPEGILDEAKDFLLDRLDDVLEPLARTVGGKVLWDEMKENGELATRSADGACRVVTEEIRRLMDKAATPPKIHLAAHSAGSIFFAYLIDLLTTKGTIQKGLLKGREGLGCTIETVTLWAPAITAESFKDTYGPALSDGRVKRFALYTLTDKAERDDDCAKIYNKSLLYLVSHAFEDSLPIPFRRGTPLLGMERHIERDATLKALLQGPGSDWVLAPNSFTDERASRATSHGAFDDDGETLRSTFARVLGDGGVAGPVVTQTSADSHRDRRESLEFQERSRR
jgi:hypothetical protein